MPRPPSSRPHDAEAGREPPSHASGLAPSALIHALDDLQPDPLNANRGTDRGRAIDPAAVERMCDATRGAHISPGELEHLWRGPPGPPAGAWYCTGIDWAQGDSTVAAGTADHGVDWAQKRDHTAAVAGAALRMTRRWRTSRRSPPTTLQGVTLVVAGRTARSGVHGRRHDCARVRGPSR